MAKVFRLKSEVLTQVQRLLSDLEPADRREVVRQVQAGGLLVDARRGSNPACRLPSVAEVIESGLWPEATADLMTATPDVQVIYRRRLQTHIAKLAAWERVRTYCTRMMAGAPHKHALILAKIPPMSFHRWCRVHPGIAEAVSAARGGTWVDLPLEDYERRADERAREIRRISEQRRQRLAAGENRPAEKPAEGRTLEPGW